MNITARGRDFLMMTQEVSREHSLQVGMLRGAGAKAPYEEWHMYELFSEVLKSGWTCRENAATNKLQAYTGGRARKVFYYTAATSRGGLKSTYLISLLRAKELIQRGAPGIHHFQVRGYYQALLTVQGDKLKHIKANQPQAYYQLLMQNGPRPRAASAAADVQLEAEEGERVRVMTGHCRSYNVVQMFMLACSR